ncbi:MAG: VCBS repeat-containing protein [Nitrospirae bacterium]|nr:VCBS repeat-containing protein [Nitrospirota bacterium]
MKTYKEGFALSRPSHKGTRPLDPVNILTRPFNISMVVSALLLLILVTPLTASPTLEGCAMFPANNVWNTPIDKLPVDPNSSAYIATIGADKELHPAFGEGYSHGAPIGMPYNVVSSSQPKVNVTFLYDSESDPGPYPIPPNAEIEGGYQSTDDRHLLILEKDNCLLYELHYAYPQSDGSWQATSGATFDLKSNALRPDKWTSADAAGLPILPGLIRYDEVASGQINHAIRVTVDQTRYAYIWPARHRSSSVTAVNYPPMGQRFRLKASFDISGFSTQAQVILTALKKYGMIIADNGNPWYLSGVPDPRWDGDALVTEFYRVLGSDFEAVDESSLMIDPDSGQARSSIVKNDFNSDGKSDILWRNTSLDQTAVWFVNGSVLSGAVFLGPAGTAWQIRGKGDFDGDGNSDILWYNTTRGDVVIWFVGATTKISKAVSLGTVATVWQIQYVGDFNGDGNSDIIWLNTDTGQVATWLLNGTAIASAGFLGFVDPQWQMAGFGDANGDGKDDVFWYNPVTGQLAIWLLDGKAISSSRSLGISGLPWQFQGVGDFNGDGSADILWQNSATGQTAVWLLKNATVKSVSVVGVVNSPYQFKGIGDFNGDGTADIIWQNSASGDVIVWLINNSSIVGTGILGKVDAQWMVR